MKRNFPKAFLVTWVAVLAISAFCAYDFFTMDSADANTPLPEATSPPAVFPSYAYEEPVTTDGEIVFHRPLEENNFFDRP